MKRLMVAVITVLLLLPSCQNNNITLSNDTSSFSGNDSHVSDEMPDIVFMNIITYSEYSKTEKDSAITFYDKNGNHYTSDDQTVCSLSFEDLQKKYADGELKDKIKLHSSCDVNELNENFQKLLELSNNKKLEIIYPEVFPDVEADRFAWYGFYYDDKDKLQYLILHKREYTIDLNANDEKANEIYQWYISTFKK